MLTRIRRSWPTLRPFAIGGAWFFIVVSLAHLAWAIAAKSGSPGGLVTLYQTSVGDEVYRAWGLAYHGWSGLLLVLFQAAAVTTAAVLTVLPFRRGRRIGHTVLVLWAGLWLTDLTALAGADGQLDSFAQVLGRAERNWRCRRRQ